MQKILSSIAIIFLLIWIPIDATGSIGRGVAIGLFAVFCFFGFKNALLDDYFQKSDGEREIKQ